MRNEHGELISAGRMVHAMPVSATQWQITICTVGAGKAETETVCLHRDEIRALAERVEAAQKGQLTGCDEMLPQVPTTNWKR